MNFCYIHKNNPAKQRCTRCGEWICEGCIQIYDNYGNYLEVCPKCYQILMDTLKDFEKLDFF